MICIMQDHRRFTHASHGGAAPPNRLDCPMTTPPDQAHAHQYPPQQPFSVGLSGACPRCGQGRLFDGVLKLAPRCRACGLDYDFADAGDGPAVFVILIAGFLLMGAALFVEFTFNPPVWLHVLLWLPLSIIVCVTLLRLCKGVMIALQYAHQAAEGRLRED